MQNISDAGNEDQPVRGKAYLTEVVATFESVGAEQPRTALSVAEPDVVVFSVLDDMRLYGMDALEGEYSARQYDPYTLYKQRLSQTMPRRDQRATA